MNRVHRLHRLWIGILGFPAHRLHIQAALGRHLLNLLFRGERISVVDQVGVQSLRHPVVLSELLRPLHLWCCRPSL